MNSTLLQIVSITCETLGLTLTFVEVKYPTIADKVENFIDNLEDKAKVATGNLISNSVLNIVFIIFITILFFVIIPSYFHVFAHFHNKVIDIIVKVIFKLFPFILIITIIPISIAALGDFIKWLNKVADGRALGAFGLIIAVIGTIGEYIQLIN